MGRPNGISPQRRREHRERRNREETKRRDSRVDPPSRALKGAAMGDYRSRVAGGALQFVK